MQFSRPAGTAVVIHNGVVKKLPFGPGYYPGTYALNPKSSLEIDLPDYDARFDVYFHMSDDGTRFYDTVHVLRETDGETNGIALPAAADLEAGAAPLLNAMMRDVSAGMFQAEDLTFAINTLNKPTWMYAAWAKAGGNVAAALGQVVQDVFMD